MRSKQPSTHRESRVGDERSRVGEGRGRVGEAGISRWGRITVAQTLRLIHTHQTV